MTDPYGLVDVASVPVAVVFSLRVWVYSVRLLPLSLFARMLTSYFLLVEWSFWMVRVPFFFVQFVVFWCSGWISCWMVLLSAVMAGCFPCKMFLSVVLPPGAVFSPKQNLRILSLFLLYSRTVLHATKCISRGLGSCNCGGVGFWYVSVAIAESLFGFVCLLCYVCRLILWLVCYQLWFHLELYSIMVLRFPLVLVLFSLVFFWLLVFFYLIVRRSYLRMLFLIYRVLS